MLNIQKNNSLTCRKPPMPKKNKQETAVAPEGFPILTIIFYLKKITEYTQKNSITFFQKNQNQFSDQVGY